MMLLRYSEAEKVLRSVGDPPNGVVCLAAPGGDPTFCIEGRWEPPDASKLEDGEVRVVAMTTESGLGPESEPVEAEELVAAAESLAECRMLWHMGISSLQVLVAQAAMEPGKLEQVTRLTLLMRELREAFDERWGKEGDNADA